LRLKSVGEGLAIGKHGPKTVPVDRRERLRLFQQVVLPGALLYEEAGMSLAANVGHREEFVALREHRPGDPLRHIQ